MQQAAQLSQSDRATP